MVMSVQGGSWPLLMVEATDYDPSASLGCEREGSWACLTSHSRSPWRSAKPMGRLRRFLALPATQRLLTIEAALCLAIASLMLALLPFRLVARRLGSQGELAEPDVEPARLRLIGHAVGRAARHLPWRPLCLPQAMAAQAMLRRRAIASTLHFGAKRESQDPVVRAHAWLTAGNSGVIGAPDQDEFTVLARFSNRPIKSGLD